MAQILAKTQPVQRRMAGPKTAEGSNTLAVFYAIVARQPHSQAAPSYQYQRAPAKCAQKARAETMRQPTSHTDPVPGGPDHMQVIAALPFGLPLVETRNTISTRRAG